MNTKMGYFLLLFSPFSLSLFAATTLIFTAVVTYANNMLGSRGPRKMKVAVPRIQPDGNPSRFQPTS